MIEKTFYFGAGLPRSASTLTACLLNQNDKLYATPTSPLLDLLYLNETEWRNTPSVIASGHDQSQLLRLSESIINGCWQHVPANTIIDRHRAWGRNLPVINQVFGKKAKMIISVRDITEIIASFFTLLKNSSQPVTYIDKMLIERGKFLTDYNRAECLWNDFIKDTWESFRTGYSYDKTCLLIVEYNDLMNDPRHELNRIYDFLEMDRYTHNFDHIESLFQDDDLAAWGISGLHTIRPKFGRISKPAIEIIGDQLYEKYHNMHLEFWRDQ
jgi:sulfotransferase